MAIHKIVLDEEFVEEFSLVAIHCSEEAYKVAFLINQHLKLNLKRRKSDLYFSEKDMEVSVPIFQFEDQFQYTNYHLVSNKCKSKVVNSDSESGLFAGTNSEKTVMIHLLPEFKNADFFLKIESDFEQIPLRKNIAIINEIKQIISAYEIEADQIKSNNNLIFN
ncbi:MAG: IPExxxVDY family protein [Bacteroidota bacterium]